MRKLLGTIGCCLLLGAGLAGPWAGLAQAAQAGKLVVIVMENERFSDIVGNSQAPYLNQLIGKGELFTNYTAVASGSNPNYLAMTSGLTAEQSPPSPNIFKAIDGSGGTLAWKEFMESAPGNCASGTSANIPGTSVPLYTADHDPAYSYRSAITCSANDVPMTTSTFNPASLPSLSYVVPNQCDDMHTLPGTGQSCPAFFGSNTGTSLMNLGDNWLAHVVPTLLAQPNVTVLITWDEGSLQTTPPMQVVALEAGAGVTPGLTSGTAYTHYGLEAGMYSYFGLGTAPNNGATATQLPISSPAPAPAPTVSSFTPTSGNVGTSVTITGTGFTGATGVTFNGTAATFTVNSDTQITAAVPLGEHRADRGDRPRRHRDQLVLVHRHYPGGACRLVLLPTSGPVGTSVTITGTGFTGATGATFNGTTATFTVNSDTQITATLPSGASTGPIAVTGPGGTGTSTSSFTVIVPTPTVSSFSPTSGRRGPR